MKKFILSIFVASFALTSCSDFFDVTANDTLLNDDHYKSTSNVFAAYSGLLTTIQNVAAYNIIINDLRSDVLTPTSGAPNDYWEIFNFQATNGNELVDPTPFYNIILNANDFLRKARIFKENYSGYIEETYYEQLIGSAIATRSWAYLQLGKIYGEAAYYDYSMTSDEVDLSTIPVLSFDELIDELIYFMIEGIDGISGICRVDIPEMFSEEGDMGEYWRTMCISADALMMELYMWRGDYTAAVTQGIRLIHGEGVYVYSDLDRYTLSDVYSMGAWDALFNLTVSSDITAAINDEALTYVRFDSSMGQENELHYLFSLTYPNVYYIKPTDRLITLFRNSMYYGLDDDASRAPTDYRAGSITYGREMGDTVLMKYHNNGRTAYDRDAPIYIYRASEIHLMIAEALVHLGSLEAASIFLNDGLSSIYTGTAASPFYTPCDAPIYDRAYLREGMGVRGRVNAPAIDYLDEEFYYGVDTTDATVYTERQTYVLDSLIAVESALELAGEGKRWFTLMRMARNLDEPSFLIDQIVQKYSEEEQMRYRVLLNDTDNWFIKYDLGLSNE